MKRITTYVSPTRVHRLIGELGQSGIKEIKVVAYFKPLSEVSRIELLCEDSAVERVVRITHEVGTTGGLPDHLILVNDFKPRPVNRSAVGRKMGQLDD
ncbi:MAG: hypothetical protein M1378_01565 [Bacteroidetes bacterium]|nr:hypothetical protein [Bacteroidota bacterium]